jgi:hypothetical protein
MRTGRPRVHVVHDARDSRLWQVVNEYFPKLVDYVHRHDQHIPAFVERELEAFLACGQIERGFTHIRCTTCDARQLVPFTCKSRALCPTCCGRRMNQTALHLVESVIPRVPVRQFVLTFPPPLRYLLAYDNTLCSRALALFVEQVIGRYRFILSREHDVDIDRLQGGTITSIQRAGSALQASLHFHTIAIDGVYLVSENDGEPPRFLAAPALTRADTQSIAWSTCQAVMEMLRQHGVDLTGDADDLDRLAQEHPLLARSLAASQQGVVGVGDDAGRRLVRARRVVDDIVSTEPAHGSQTPGYGFDLHAGVRIPADDRRRLERLCRYILSPPVSSERISRTQDGRIAYRLKRCWSDGTDVVYFSGLDFLSKLMALIPRPRVHLLRYHGCLAPRSPIRRQVVPHSSSSVRRRRSDGSQLRLFERPRSHRWVPRTELLSHVFGDDAARCRVCGSGRLEVVAVVRRWEAIAKVLTSLGLSADGRVLARCRGPPEAQLELSFSATAVDRDAA